MKLFSTRVKPYKVVILYESDYWLGVMLKTKWRMSVEKCISHALKKIGWLVPSQVNLLLANDEAITTLNTKYLRKNNPTNVLSFPLNKFSEPQNLVEESNISKEKGMLLLGDVVFSFESVLKESEEFEITFLDHFYHLLVHGILHLLGYDHFDEASSDVMESIEIGILDDFDIKNPYRDILIGSN